MPDKRELVSCGLVACAAAFGASMLTQGLCKPVVVRAEGHQNSPTAAVELRGRSDAPDRDRSKHDPSLDLNPSRIEDSLPLADAISAEKEIQQASPTPRPKPAAGFEGIAIPGQQITLKVEQSSPTAQIRWMQTAGDEVILDDPSSRSPKFTVPEGVEKLEFLLVASDAAGTEVAKLTIPIVAGSGRDAAAQLRPDAGDDQLGIVGRQITLNGMRSEPRGQVAFRWIQVGGPKVRLELDQGGIYSFVPQAPGVYQFALVVARDKAISKPDYVDVSVGNPSSHYGLEPTPEPPQALHDVARAGLTAVPGGLEVALSMAEAFDAVADRCDLYRSYAEAYSELGRRLERLLPPDAPRRDLWNERLFVPLTQRMVEGLRAEGLDLRDPEARGDALTTGQKAKLAELFRAMAEGFRATQPTPYSGPVSADPPQ